MAGSDLFTGTLDLLILRCLSPGPLHGYAIRRMLSAVSDGALEMDEGALYHALHRLAGRGDLEASWGHSETGRRVKFYELTAAGRSSLADGIAHWRTFSAAVNEVLGSWKNE